MNPSQQDAPEPELFYGERNEENGIMRRTISIAVVQVFPLERDYNLSAPFVKIYLCKMQGSFKFPTIHDEDSWIDVVWDEETSYFIKHSNETVSQDDTDVCSSSWELVHTSTFYSIERALITATRRSTCTCKHKYKSSNTLSGPHHLHTIRRSD
jgi:hypothetical protein